MKPPVLLWFRQDLRLSDHPALIASLKNENAVIPVYILDQETAEPWAMGGASLWWLHHSLASLAQEIEQKGARLILRRGSSLHHLSDLVRQTQAQEIYFTRCYEPHAVRLEQALQEMMKPLGVSCRRYSGSLLFEPEEIVSGSGTPYKVFTPFWKACLQKDATLSGAFKKPLSAPEKLPCYDAEIISDHLSDWKLLPTQPNWAAGFPEHWQPGEKDAHQRIGQFLETALEDYDDNRNKPGIAGTSRLSPHLHFGEISVRQCWHWVKAFTEAHIKANKGGQSFLRELGWREFSAHLLFHWPTLPNQAFRPEFEKLEFDKFPWAGRQEHLQAWQKGQTGYPIIDAGMRQLWQTGWMHNRVRMIVASFLIKHLLISWQKGEAWFWNTLVDADLANNAASWQWVAGSGADAAPYFRIFNPVLQSGKFDPEGAYIRRWVPELARLSNKEIHAPWEVPESRLATCGIHLGKTYPAPIVDHATARKRALEIFEQMKLSI